MPNYGRAIQVTAGPASYGFSGAGPDASAALRIRFNLKLGVSLGFNTGTVRITNPNPATAQQLVQQQASNLPIMISAGYADNNGVIFNGEIKQAIYGRENPTDTLLTLVCSTRDVGINYGTVNQSLAAGSTMLDHFNHAVAGIAAASPTPISAGYIDPALNIATPAYAKSVQLYGMARDTLRRIARSKAADVFEDQGQVNLLGYANSMPGAAVVLNSKSGLVGMPTLELGGIMVRALITPAIRIGKNIQVAQSQIQQAQKAIVAGESDVTQYPSIAADGVYKVLTIIYDGDTRGLPWYADLGCRAASGAAAAFTPPALNRSPAAGPT